MNKTSGDASLGIDANLEQQTSEKAQLLYSEDRQRYHAKIDRLFCLLFCIQWPAAIALAVFMTPTTWAGTTSSVHLHVFMAIGLGAMATVFPIWLCWRRPGAVITRHVVAASTMIFTALFIHLSGGRDEGHFHFFMMMAFVTLYFDWKVVLTAIVVGAIDHVLRTALFPISVFGVLESPWFQLFRHVLWVVFEGSVLLYGCMLVDRDKRTASQQLAVSQMREEKINDLMEKNSAASAEKEEHEKIACEAAQAKHALEHQRLEDTRVAAQKQAEETALLKHKVDKLLVSVNDAVNGNLGTRVTVNGEDAIGLVGGALDKLLGSLSANFDHIQSSADTLSDAAKELSATSSDLKNDASDASESIEQVSDSASQINHGVQDTAASTEQMNEAIREVSRCAADAVQVGEEAVLLASQATSTVEQLGISSTGIGDVLKVITSIAEQTNLLALNATIEAARAGDAGKGFAVVANEVKELAKETAKATDEISSRIKAIQSDAGNAGSVIEKISCIIEQIKEYQMTVAAAVEEQTATTREISNNVRLSAQGSADVLQGINVIADRVNRAQKSAEHFDSAALTLKGTVVQLNQLLEIYSTDSSQTKPAD